MIFDTELVNSMSTSPISFDCLMDLDPRKHINIERNSENEVLVRTKETASDVEQNLRPGHDQDKSVINVSTRLLVRHTAKDTHHQKK